LGKYFYLPELHTTRKVWYGEAESPTNPLSNTNLTPSPLPQLPSPLKSFYIIDNYSDAGQAIAISPQSKDVIMGKGVKELSEVDSLPHFWSDWKVTCTPLLHNNWFFSLTPHCINW
jgi:hypothetical protein